MQAELPQPDLFARPPAFAPDRPAMYLPMPEDYQAMVNQLASMTLAIIEHLQAQGQPELAGQIADHAHGILLDFDEDMAEYVRWFGRERPAEDMQQEQLVYTFLA
jgi:hypothetical protein